MKMNYMYIVLEELQEWIKKVYHLLLQPLKQKEEFQILKDIQNVQ